MNTYSADVANRLGTLIVHRATAGRPDPWADRRVRSIFEIDEDIVLVAFSLVGESPTYITGEHTSPYQSLGMSALEAAMTMLAHMYEIAGDGWERSLPIRHLGPLHVILTGAFRDL